jgi:phospholipid/cholesterol/gamma-HCH transport system substrate-binding protein
MQKQAPSIGRILAAAGFALSCFGLALFLWIAFGGPIPLKPQSYRVTAYFPEAHQLAQEADVRIGGVSVGNVKEIDLAPADMRVNGRDTTEAVIEIDPEFAPINSDARAILRMKTLLGETYVELTSGTDPQDADAIPVSLGAAAATSDAEAAAIAEPIPEDGTLGIGQTEVQTQIDDIFNALDEETRASFQRWMKTSADAVENRGLDLSDALGSLGPFVADATDLLRVLRGQRRALKGLVRDTGEVFEALTARDEELAGVIVGTRNTFDALAREERALAEIFQVFPTFQRESRATFERLDDFQVNTRPLIRDLIPVARELSPTLRSVRQLAPPLRSLFLKVDELVDVSQRGLPAMRRFLRGLRPVLDRLDPFLANLNPIVRFLAFYREQTADFLVGPGQALSASLPPRDGQPAPRHRLRQLTHLSTESLSHHRVRLPTNRGNGYLSPLALNSFRAAVGGIFPNFDCKNTNYDIGTQEGDPETRNEIEIPHGATHPDVNQGQPPGVNFAPCIIQGDFPDRFGGQRFPEIFSDP